MSKTVQIVIFLTVIIIVLAGVSVVLTSATDKPGKLDSFTSCLGEKGAIFYGAFWCLHCQNQKKMFGQSEKLLPYVECSTPDGKSQLAICKEKGVEGYPTWFFADGSRESGEIPLERLSEKTGCSLPK